VKKDFVKRLLSLAVVLEAATGPAGRTQRSRNVDASKNIFCGNMDFSI
jgi:hypothetical protein